MSMSRIPANRLLIFLLVAAVALTVDLYTKSVVFNDLGYPGAEPQASFVGQHDRFAFPATREGESVPYLDGWMTFRLLTSFQSGRSLGIGTRVYLAVRRVEPGGRRGDSRVAVRFLRRAASG